MTIEERVSQLEQNMEVQFQSKVNQIVQEKLKELRNEFDKKLENMQKDFEIKLTKAQSEQM